MLGFKLVQGIWLQSSTHVLNSVDGLVKLTLEQNLLPLNDIHYMKYFVISVIFTEDSFHLKNNIDLTEVTKTSYALHIDYLSHSEA